MTDIATDLERQVREIATQARAASLVLATTPTVDKNACLDRLAEMIESSAEQLKVENVKDLEAGKENGLSTALLDRLHLTDERIAELTEELTGSVPEGLQIREDDEPWSISFDWRQPVTVEFVDQTMKIAVRGRTFTSGDRTLNKVMEMSATYAMQVTSTGVQLQRQGEIEVRFPGDENERLRAMDRVFKTLMQKKFSEVFKTEIQGKGFSLPGQFESLGVIRLKDLSAEGGWLSLGWN